MATQRTVVFLLLSVALVDVLTAQPHSRVRRQETQVLTVEPGSTLVVQQPAAPNVDVKTSNTVHNNVNPEIVNPAPAPAVVTETVVVTPATHETASVSVIQHGTGTLTAATGGTVGWGIGALPVGLGLGIGGLGLGGLGGLGFPGVILG